MTRAMLVGLWLMLGLLIAACDAPPETSGENPIVYGLTLEPSGIDPHINQSAELGIVLRQVYDTLVYRDPDTREIVPGLATAWTFSDDNRVLTFTLRQDVVFHDGTPFDAAAVAANLDRITNPETGSQKAVFLLGPLVSYDVVDTFTIQLVFQEPFAPILDSFSQVYLGMASPQALSQYNNLRYQFHQVGTGPYTFESYTPGDRIVLRRNEAYAWGPAFYDAPQPGIADEIIFRFYLDSATRSIALETGEAQVMGEIPPSVAAAVSASGRIELLPTRIPGLPLQFMMNTALAPTDDRRMRQALLYATNRGVIVDTVYRGFSEVAWGPLSRETLYYTDEVEGLYGYNVDQARALLEAVGYQDSNEDGLLDRAGETLDVVLLVPPWGLIPEVAQVLQDQWREVGIRVRLEQVSGFAALREAVAEGNYHLVAFDTAGYDPYIMNTFYASDGINNFTNYSNAELDAALIAATQDLSPSSRRARYNQIQRFIMDEALILPVRDYTNLNGVVPDIEELIFDPYGWFPLLANVRYGAE